MTDQIQPVCDTDPMEADVTAVIEACGGDPKTAIKTLLVENPIQEQRIERLAASLSFGYVRGRIGVTTRSGPSRT
jgi:prolyl-tRNA editing enzyme YbaK/EbsC (Cys-tRNA(Pro) deacylase)